MAIPGPLFCSVARAFLNHHKDTVRECAFASRLIFLAERRARSCFMSRGGSGWIDLFDRAPPPAAISSSPSLLQPHRGNRAICGEHPETSTVH